MINSQCKACNSKYREFIDGQMRAGSSMQAICNSLEARGEMTTIASLSRHRKHMLAEDEEHLDEDIETTVAQLREERNRVAPTMRASYSILIAFLESIKGKKAPSAREAMMAEQSISRFGGMDSKMRFLLDFAEAAWSPGGSMTSPVGATSSEDFPPVPEELADVARLEETADES